MSLASKIQSLLSAANSKTGGTATDLTQAVQALCDGYGQGGGVSAINGRAFDCGTFSLEADQTTNFTINHSLGVVPSAFWLYIIDPPTQENGENIRYKFGAVRTNSESSYLSVSMHFANGYANAGAGASANANRIEWTDTTVQIWVSTTYPLRAGLTYEWIALGGLV